MVCTGNTIAYSKQAQGAVSGILLTCEDCIVADNLIDGPVWRGIFVAVNRRNTTSGGNNLQIRGNTIRGLNEKRVAGIGVRTFGRNITIRDNLITDINAVQGDCAGIQIEPTGGEIANLLIEGNLVNDLRAQQGSALGVHFNARDSAAGPVARCAVRANHFDGMDSALGFDGFSGAGRLRDISVADNRMFALRGQTLRGAPANLRLEDSGGAQRADPGAAGLRTLEVRLTHRDLARGRRKVIVTPGAGGQLKVRDIMLVGSRSEFMDGDRSLAITDGATTWSLVAPETLRSLGTARWGSKDLIFPEDPAAVLRPSRQGAPIFAVYQGGSQDHLSGRLSLLLTVSTDE